MVRKYLVDEYPISEQTAIELMDGARKLLGLEWIIWDNTPEDIESFIERRDEIRAQFRPTYLDTESAGPHRWLKYVTPNTPASLLVNEWLSDAYLVSPHNYTLPRIHEESILHISTSLNYADAPAQPFCVQSAYESIDPVQAQNLKDLLKQLGIEMLE